VRRVALADHVIATDDGEAPAANARAQLRARSIADQHVAAEDGDDAGIE
jgi:hypothetical protein